MKTKNLFLLLIVIFSLNGASAKQNRSARLLADKMSKAFEAILRENYGDNHTTQQNYLLFLNDFKTNRAVFLLKNERQKLSEINNDLFKDRIYTLFYKHIGVRFDLDSIKKNLEMITHKTDSVYLGRSRDDLLIKYRVLYFANNGYAMQLLNSSNSDVLKNGKMTLNEVGKFDVNVLIDEIQRYPNELKLRSVRRFLAVSFWPFICYCNNYDFIKRKIKSRYLIPTQDQEVL